MDEKDALEQLVEDAKAAEKAAIDLKEPSHEDLVRIVIGDFLPIVTTIGQELLERDAELAQRIEDIEGKIAQTGLLNALGDVATPEFFTGVAALCQAVLAMEGMNEDVVDLATRLFEISKAALGVKEDGQEEESAG